MNRRERMAKAATTERYQPDVTIGICLNSAGQKAVGLEIKGNGHATICMTARAARAYAEALELAATKLDELNGAPEGAGGVFAATLYDEMKRLQDEESQRLLDIVSRHPERRFEVAESLLGGAIAVCDTFGIDAESVLREIRRREPKPAVLVPPAEGMS